MATTTRKPESNLASAVKARPTPALGRGRPSRAMVVHRNTISLVGDLVSPVEPRVRADGHEVLTFRISVRVPTVVAIHTATTVDGKEPGITSRSDTGLARRDMLDCVVAAPALRRRLEQYQPGDVVEVDGALRHRFWNASGRVQSRYEIDVLRLKRLARDRTNRPAPAIDVAD